MTAGGRTSNTLAQLSRNMGQDMFGPPDVAGLGYQSRVGQHRKHARAIQLREHLREQPQHDQSRNLCDQRSTPDHTKASSKKTVKRFFARLGPLSSAALAEMLRTYLETGDNGQPVTYVNDDATVDKKIRGLVHQIMCLPEFQLN